MSRYFLVLFSFFLFLQSCNDNPVDQNNDTSFRVEVKVVDPGGNVVSGVNVSVWSKYQYPGSLYKDGSGNKITSATSILYSIKEQCFVDLVLYDYKNNINSQIISAPQQPGRYNVQYSITENAGTAVYKCKMTASADASNNNILFQDSIYLVLHQPDPSISVIGKSNNNGVVTIANKNLFPHFLNLPPMPVTGEASPDILGYYNISDTVVITLSDQSFSQSIMYEHKIINGKNSFTLVWDEGLTNTTGKRIIESTANADTTILDYFYGYSLDGDVILKWRTFKEQNNLGFDVEKKISDQWHPIGFVDGHGTTNDPQLYTFVQEEVSPGIHFYRLKQKSTTGVFEYSAEVEVDVEVIAEWKLYQNYPNPFN